MALTDLTSVKLIPGMDGQSDDFLTMLINAASAAIENWVGDKFASQEYVEFYSGSNSPDLVLRHTPVLSVTEIREDPTGYAGDGPNAFADSTVLTAGTDYYLERDDGTQSRRGIVKRITGALSPANFIGYYGQVTAVSGKLYASRAAVWHYGQDNLKVTYQAGFAAIPDDVKMAANMMVAWYVRNVPAGAPLASESLGGYSYSVAFQTFSERMAEIGTVPALLSRYVKISF